MSVSETKIKSKKHLPVKRFLTPEDFKQWRQIAIGIGFSEIASGPFVRSSYHAKELYQALGPLILKRNAEV
jgi:lipoic acid synthetase